MKTLLVIYLLGWISQGFPAPLDDGDNNHRESTKAILTLEQQLKQQAGEDKKFFSEDTPQGKADQQALEDLAAAGAAQDQQDPATLDELTALMGEPLGNEAEVPADLPIQVPDEPAVNDDEPEVDTSSEDDQPEVDDKSPYRVYAVSEKRLSQPEVAPEVPTEVPEIEEYPSEDNNDFAENLIDFLQRYPQIAGLMDESRTRAEYQEMLRLQNEADREDAIKAEMLASQQKQAGNPMEDQLAYGGEYNSDYPMSVEEASYRNPEVEQQQYYGDTIGRTVAKKRGYETPPEYLEWLRSLTPEEEQEVLNIDERAADHDNTEEAAQQNSYMSAVM